MHLYLMGYRGTGKSTVGRLLAARLGWPVIDTDDLVEATAGKSIREIFEGEQESGFRQREEAAVAQAAAQIVPTIISLGGGAILMPTNQQLIVRTGQVVWLQASPEHLVSRMQGDASTAARRPKLSQQNDYDEVVEILARREPIYRQLAGLTLSTDRCTPDGIVADIVNWLNANGLLE